jgi:hypothetical protein
MSCDWFIESLVLMRSLIPTLGSLDQFSLFKVKRLHSHLNIHTTYVLISYVRKPDSYCLQ